MNSLEFIANVIYQLKREYGGAVSIQRRTANTLNLETGKKTQTKDAIHVPLAIVLPTRLIRKFDYDLTYIASNKSFTYGGFYDADFREFIFDAKDLPAGFAFNLDDALIYKHVRWELKELSAFEDNTAFTIIAKRVKDEPADAVTEKTLYHELELADEAVAEL